MHISHLTSQLIIRNPLLNNNSLFPSPLLLLKRDIYARNRPNNISICLYPLLPDVIGYQARKQIHVTI